MENRNKIYYLDNRDIRDNRYEGPLVILAPEGEGIPKERALLVMKDILEHDLKYNNEVIAKLEKDIDIRNESNKLILDRLKEF